jgi:hypothetical protein
MTDELREGAVVLYKGERWVVLGLDSDPRASVWLFREADPDDDVFASRDELEVVRS